MNNLAFWRMKVCLSSFRTFLFLLLLLVSHLAAAQASTASPNSSAGTLLTPGQFLGYKLGANFTPHAELLRYVDHVVQHSGGRMRCNPTAAPTRTARWKWCRSPAPENLSRFEDMRRNNLRRAGLESGAGQAPAARHCVAELQRARQRSRVVGGRDAGALRPGQPPGPADAALASRIPSCCWTPA